MNRSAHWIGSLSIFVSALLFGTGLSVSGMTNPAKVVGFLDVAGDWDPSLVLVMVAGLLITVPAFHLVLRRPEPLFDKKFFLPTQKTIDARLIGGAVLFGAGWGIAGFCPGPAITALVSLNETVLLFVAAMIAGMYLHHFLFERNS